MALGKRRYALHGKPGFPTFEGLLVRRTPNYFVLHDATILEDVNRTHTVEGRAEVLRENVLFLERK